MLAHDGVGGVTESPYHLFVDLDLFLVADPHGAEQVFFFEVDEERPRLLADARRIERNHSFDRLTGHADKQSAIQAINEVGLYQYVEKPWENAQLLLIIQNGIERSKLLRELREKVSELQRFTEILKSILNDPAKSQITIVSWA